MKKASLRYKNKDREDNWKDYSMELRDWHADKESKGGKWKEKFT